MYNYLNSVIEPWDGIVNFTIKDYRDGSLISEEEYSLKMSENIDERYKDIVGENGEIITNRSELRAKLKSNRRKACIACGDSAHPYGTEYVRKQIISANDRLKECRRMHPHAGGLIVCDGIEHANSIAKALKHLTGEESVVVHSDTGKDARSITRTLENIKDPEQIEKAIKTENVERLENHPKQLKN